MSGKWLLRCLTAISSIWLCHLINHFLFMYLDDMLNFSRHMKELVGHVRAVLQRLLENKLYVKAKTCKFHSEPSFLGFLLQPVRVTMDPAKVAAVTDWPESRNYKQLQWFLGFANFYQKFIQNFSKVAVTLRLSTKIHFVRSSWSSFWKTDSVLYCSKTPDGGPTQAIAEVDGCSTGVDAILSQRQEEDRKVLHSLFFLIDSESDLLVIKLTLEEWWHCFREKTIHLWFGTTTEIWRILRLIDI